MLLTANAFAVLTTIAYAVLAAAGAVLWKRNRSLGAALITIGFAMVLADQLVLRAQDIQLSAILHGRSVDTLFVVYHHAFLRYTGLFGLWLAGVGLVWHALRTSAR